MIRHALIIALILIAWVVCSAAFFVVTDMAPGALVIFPSSELRKNLPEDVRVLDWRQSRLVLVSDQPGYVRRLYRAGAWLVLPARKNGCVALRSASASSPLQGASEVRPGQFGGWPVD